VSLEHWWNGKPNGETEVLGGVGESTCHVVENKSHIDGLGTEGK